MVIVNLKMEELYWRVQQIVSLIVNRCAMETAIMFRMRPKVAIFAMVAQVVSMGETLHGSMLRTGKIEVNSNSYGQYEISND